MANDAIQHPHFRTSRTAGQWLQPLISGASRFGTYTDRLAMMWYATLRARQRGWEWLASCRDSCGGGSARVAIRVQLEREIYIFMLARCFLRQPSNGRPRRWCRTLRIRLALIFTLSLFLTPAVSFGLRVWHPNLLPDLQHQDHQNLCVSAERGTETVVLGKCSGGPGKAYLS